MAFPARKVFGTFEKRASVSRKSRELEWFRNLPQLHFDHVSYGFLSSNIFCLRRTLVYQLLRFITKQQENKF